MFKTYALDSKVRVFCSKQIMFNIFNLQIYLLRNVCIHHVDTN